MDSTTLRALERSSYYSVVRALYACGRLETFENEMLLTDLAESLNISEQDRLAFLLQVGQDAEVVRLKSFGAEEAPAAVAAAAVAGAAMPAAPSQQHAHAHAPAPRAAAPPQPLSIPQYQTPFLHSAVSAPSSKSKKKGAGAGAGMAPPSSGGVAKPTLKKTKSGASTPSTPRSQQPKATPKSSERKLVGAAAAAQQNAQLKAAQLEWDRLTAREREIFELLLSLGVREDDPELNGVHRNLLRWYRLDARERQIAHELNRPDMIMV